jgi:cytoskeletal protein CcmA (bactofilin family)
MLESFRKKDAPRAGSVVPPSPYNALQEALSPAKPVEAPKPDAARADSTPKTEAPKTETRAEVIELVDATPAPESVSRLIVGPDIKLKGVEITDCDTLVVEGRVEASMDSRVIQVAENGVFIGKVGIDIAEIRGRFEGELDARKQLVIRSTGRVSGKIRYGKITIEEGGELSGDVASLGTQKSQPTNDSSFGPSVKAVASR